MLRWLLDFILFFSFFIILFFLSFALWLIPTMNLQRLSSELFSFYVKQTYSKNISYDKQTYVSCFDERLINCKSCNYFTHFKNSSLNALTQCIYCYVRLFSFFSNVKIIYASVFFTFESSSSLLLYFELHLFWTLDLECIKQMWFLCYRA